MECAAALAQVKWRRAAAVAARGRSSVQRAQLPGCPILKGGEANRLAKMQKMSDRSSVETVDFVHRFHSKCPVMADKPVLRCAPARKCMAQKSKVKVHRFLAEAESCWKQRINSSNSVQIGAVDTALRADSTHTRIEQGERENKVRAGFPSNRTRLRFQG